MVLAASAGEERVAWKRHHRDWSALPDLPLSVVAGRLHTFKDFLSFRGVCTSWRSVGTAVAEDVMASHPPIFFGTQLLGFSDLNNFGCGGGARRFYHPGEDRIYVGNTPLVRDTYNILGVSHGYYILGCDSGRATISNPLTGEEIRDCFPRSRRGLRFSRALLSSPPTSPGCVLVQWDRYWNIQYCRPGDKEWCQVLLFHHLPLRPRWTPPISDEGSCSVAVVGSFDLVAAQSTSTLNVLQDGDVPDGTRSWYPLRFLAEHNGELLALPATEWKTGRFAEDFPVAVLRFDVSSRKWVVLDDLGGCAVLVQYSWMSAVFVDGGSCLERWGGSKDCVYACDSIDGRLLEYKMNDRATYDPYLSCWHRFARLSDHGLFGRWVHPRLLLSPFRLYGC